MAVLGRLRFWQIVVIFFLLMTGVGGAYFYLDVVQAREQGSATLTDNEQLVTVVRGDLVNQVQVGGTLTLPRRESVRLGADSVVKDVLVVEGQAVIEGQALLTLDDVTVAQHDMEVARARIVLRDAQVALENLRPNAESDLVDAQVAVIEDERTLGKTNEEHNEEVSIAAKVVEQAEQSYADIYSAWLGLTLQPQDLQQSPTALLTSWDLDLDWLLGPDGPFDASLSPFALATPDDDPATLWSEILVYGIVNFYPGTVVATCEDTERHPANGHCLKKGFDDEWEELIDARENLEDAIEDRDNSLKQAQHDLIAAIDKREQAEIALQDASEGEQGYARQLKEAELVTARVALQEAIKKREENTIRAPINGIVAVLNAVPGEPLDTASRVAVEIIDTSVVELAGLIDETDILRIDYGDPAEITLDALPGQIFSGEITSISSAAELQQGIAVFTIMIRVNVSSDVDLREGMNATARMAVERQNDVLLVPVQSIYGTFREPLLRVMADDLINSRPVTLGSNDDFWVVVEDGVNEGEEVIMHVSQADEFAAFQGGPGFQRQTTRTVRVAG